MKDNELTMQQHRSIAIYVQKDYRGWNKGDVAKEMGVNDRTLRRWRQDETYIAELNKQAKLLNDRFMPIANAEMRRLITDSSVEDRDKLKAIRMFLNSYGLLTNDVETETTNGLINIDVADLGVR